MAWLDWIIEHFSEVWEIAVVLLGIAIYLAKKNKDGLLGDVWRDVKAKLVELAKEALQEVGRGDVAAVAGPFWDNVLADIKVLRLFGINKDWFLNWCWAQWQRFIALQDGVERNVARRKRMGSRAFNA